METKITKGEWILKEQGDASEYCILTPENRWVVAFRLNGERMEEEIANAKLIAAAPELLNALELCRPYMQDLENENFEDRQAGILKDWELSIAFVSLENAIKKATE